MLNSLFLHYCSMVARQILMCSFPISSYHSLQKECVLNVLLSVWMISLLHDIYIYIYIYYWNMTLSGILSRSAAKNPIAYIRLFKNNCADYVQCSSSLLCLPSEHQGWLQLPSLGLRCNSLGLHTSISPLAIAFHIRFWKVSCDGTFVRDIGSWFQHLIV